MSQKNKRQRFNDGTKVFLIVGVLVALAFLTITAKATTYYVETAANGGSDAAAGTSWATSWATVDKVNSTMIGGDTVYFATGTWWGQLQPIGGTSGDRTTYACSSFALQNMSGAYHFAKIFGGSQVTGWTVYSGNVYQASYTAASPNICFCQGDSIIWCQSALVDVNEAGEAYWDNTNDIIYAYIYNLGGAGQDPDAYDMEASYGAACHIGYDEDYITLWGLQISYGKSKTVECGGDNDYINIEHCKVTHGGGGNSTNPAAIHFPHSGAYESQSSYCLVRACSLAYGFDIRHTVSASSGHGGAISIYSVSYLTVESCQVYGYFTGDIIDFKGWTFESLSRYNTIRYNTIRADRGHFGLRFWSHISQDSVYGNIVAGNNLSDISIDVGFHSGETDTAVGDYLVVLNNTFYNCQKNWCGGCSEGYGDNATVHKKMMYNIFYQDIPSDSTSYTGDLAPLDYSQNAWDKVDSNIYYYPSAKFRANDNSVSWSTWQSTYDMDVHSTNNVDPGFNDAANGDFSRPNCDTIEMDRTYGGKLWTRYGAEQPEYTITVNNLPSTGQAADLIGIPRQQMVCLPKDTSIVVRWGLGTPYYYKSDDDGATWGTGLNASTYTNRHMHLQLYGDSLYVFDGYDGTDFVQLYIIDPYAATVSGLDKIFQDDYDIGPFGSDAGEIWSGFPTGATANEWVAVIRDGGYCDGWSVSADKGATWSSPASTSITSCEAGRIGTFPVGDSGAALIYDDFVGVFHYNTTANTWSEETPSGGGHLVTDAQVGRRSFSAVELKDTVYIGYAMQGDTGYAIVSKVIDSGVGTALNTTMWTGDNFYVNDAGQDWPGYIAMTVIENIDAIGVFYTHDNTTCLTDSARIRNMNVYFRLRYNGVWLPEQLVCDLDSCGNITAPFLVPSSHGNKAYCMVSRKWGSTATDKGRLIVVDLSNVTGAIEEEPPVTCFNATHSLVPIESTLTTVKIVDTYDFDTDSSLTRLTMIWDNDASIIDPMDSAFDITFLGSPDTLEATGLTSNTQYWFWFVTSFGTCKDTSSSVTITTEEEPPPSAKYFKCLKE